MKHYTIAIDEEQAELLIDLLTAAIALAEADEGTPHSTQSIRLISVGTPVLDDLREARSAT